LPREDERTLKTNTQPQPSDRPPRFEWLLHLVLFVVLALVFFGPVVLNPDALIYPSYSPFSDLTVIHWPNAKALVDTFRTYSQFPWWKDVSLTGMPAIANPLAMLFYPLNFLVLALPIDVVFNLLTVLHVILSGVGLYVYLRRAAGRSAPAALVASALYMFSGKLVAHVAAGHLSLIAAMAWLPWAFLAVHWAVARRELLASFLAGAVLALQVVTHTQILVYTAYALVLYAAFELWLARRDSDAGVHWRSLGSDALILLPAPVVAVALGAVQILPLVELARYSDRAFSLAQASAYSLNLPQLLAGALLPSPAVGHEYTIYPGLVTLGLALLSMSRRLNRRALFFWAMVGLALIVSLGSGGGLFALLYWAAPGWRWMRAAARSWLFLSFALSVLSAYGLDRLRTLERPLGRTLTVGIALVFGCVLLAGGLIGLYGQFSRATLALALLPLGLLALIWLRAAGKLSPALVLGLVLLLGLADLWTFDRSLLKVVTADAAFADRRDLARYLSAQQASEGLFRVYSPSYSLPQHLAAQYGLETVDGVEPVHLSRYDRFMALAGGYGVDGFSVAIPPFPDIGGLDAFRSTVPDARLLGLLNARYVVADFPLQVAGLTLDRQIGPTYVYRNDRVLPRAFVVSAIQSAADGPTALQALATVDLSREAVVEASSSGGDALAGLVGAPEAPSVPARVTLHMANRIATEVTLAAPGVLVLSEIGYPGWRAYDNGASVPIEQVDYLLRGVRLTAGSHTVLWAYEPSSLTWGRRITQVGVLLVMAALAFWAYLRAMRMGRGGLSGTPK
jgi:hypothetical protein